MRFPLQIVLIVAYITLGQTSTVDLTRVPESSGEAVVKATIALIQESCVFQNDYLFLRRLAHTSSNNGLDPKTYINGYDGGIWQISQDIFDLTKHVPGINYAMITNQFGINWSQSTWQDLRKPLFSCLAAMLTLERLSPIPKDVNGQGMFFQSHLSGNMSVFLSKTASSDVRCDAANLDMAFVIDASGSVSAGDYLKAKQFTAEVANKFNIGFDAVRVAVMSYASSIYEHISFHDFNSSVALSQAILQIPKISGRTNTGGALEALLLSVFTAQKGSRSEAAKIAIIQTDGESNSKSFTLTAAEKLRDAGVVVFAMGLGGGVDVEELNGIASSPICTHVRHLDDFTELDAVLVDIEGTACTTEVVQTADVSNVFDCSRGQTTIRLDPDVDISIITRPDVGNVVIFGSFETTQPNSAFADFISQSADDKPTIIFLKNSTKALYLTIISDTHNNGSCDSTVLVKTVPSNELIKTGADNMCIKGNALAVCSDIDFIESNDFVTSDSSLPDKVVNVCTTSSVGYHAHPDTNTKFIYCEDTGKIFVVDCPLGFAYLDATQDCSAPASTDADQVCKVCSADNFQIGLRKFPHPTSTKQYVSCLGENICTMEACTTEFVPGNQTCLIEPASAVYDPVILCNDCVMSHGVGYAPLTGHCSAYIQCMFLDEVATSVHVMTCPAGTQWNQDLLVCDFPFNVNCKETSLCSSRPVTGDKTVYDQFGADYTWTTMSCPAGYVYNNVLCSCADKIVVPVKYTCDDINMKAIAGDKSGYLQRVHDTWVRMPCPATLEFNPVSCVCDFSATHYITAPTPAPVAQTCQPTFRLTFTNGVKDSSPNGFWIENQGVKVIDGQGWFDGKSQLIVPGLSRMDLGDELLITMKYTQFDTSSHQTIVANGCCGIKPSVSVCSGPKSVDVSMMTSGAYTTAVVSVARDNQPWQKATFSLSNDKLSAATEGSAGQTSAKGAILRRQRGLVIGAGGDCAGFKGVIEEVSVYRCTPVVTY